MTYLLLVVAWLSVLGAIGGTIGAIAVKNPVWLGWTAPAFVLLFLVAPYEVWKQTDEAKRNSNKELDSLKERRLTIKVNEVDLYDSNTNMTWSNLLVQNNSGLHIKGCYGELAGFKAEMDNYARQPSIPLRLPWSSDHGVTANATNLGPGDAKKLNLLVCDNLGGLYIPKPGSDNYTRGQSGYLSEGTYILTVRVGAELEDFQPSTVVLRVTYKDKQIQISEVSSA